MTLEADRDRGIRAERLLADDLWKEAFAALEERILDSWQRSAINDIESRELAFHQLRHLRDLKKEFENYMRSGQFAAQKIETNRGKRK